MPREQEMSCYDELSWWEEVLFLLLVLFLGNSEISNFGAHLHVSTPRNCPWCDRMRGAKTRLPNGRDRVYRLPVVIHPDGLQLGPMER
jgi:hypothetical protein